MLSSLLLSNLPRPVRLLALVGVIFVAGVFGSVAVAATQRALAPEHEVPVDSLHQSVGLLGPRVEHHHRARHRRPVAIAPRSLARGVHPPRLTPAPLPEASVPVVPGAAQTLPEGPPAPGTQTLPPVTKVAPPPVALPEEEPTPPVEPPHEEPAAEEPPVEEPPVEPPHEEPPVEEPAQEEPPVEVPHEEPPVEPPHEEPPVEVPHEEPTPEEPPAEEPVPPAMPSFVGNTIRSFYLNNSEPGAVTEVPDPLGSGQTVFKFTIGDNDKTQGSTPNPRGELISRPNISNGSEFWWSTKFFLPPEYPASTPGFVTLMQLFGGQASGSPPFHLEATGGVIKWQRNATYGWDVPWQMPQITDRWVTVLSHMRFARDGFVELWIDGQQVTFFTAGTVNPNHVAPTTRLVMETMDSSNNASPNSLYLQQYRLKGMYPELTTYEGPLLIGPTRASVGG
jgi:hypothetical protein